ncbi:citrinin biosynthesis oxydoreductase CtnB [Diplocarpon rosae]|nr:citrinin biosynthesis oxydoreductase CtnB [Diplocarpon rosae]
MSFPLEPLPRIACFHGGGSTASIFKVQCEQLQKLLSGSYELVFFDAPYERDAGPGVLPAFSYEQYGPYRTWFTRSQDDKERGDGRNAEGRGEGGVERVLRLISETGGEGEWIGVMGFSQGTRVAGGVLLDQQRRREMGLPEADGELNFRFGIMCMGGAAPMVSDIVHASYSDSLINIPTLHLHGTKDINYQNGKKMWKTHYEANSTTVWDIDYHHAMPWYRADVIKFVDLIRKLDRDSVVKDETRIA